MKKLLQLLRDNANPRAEGTEPAIRLDISSGATRIYVYDVIDAWWGASAAALNEAFKAAGGVDVHLHINSPGGDVFEARAMAQAVVNYSGQVAVHIDGLAASAATYLALSGNTLSMTEGGMLMVHESWTLAYGNKGELRKTADLLAQIDQTIVADYAKRTGKPVAEVTAWVEAETWFLAAQALELGFIDSIDPNTKREADANANTNANAKAASAARWNLSAYANAPKLTPPPEPQPDLAAAAAQQQLANRNRLRLVGAN
jgi:ATP-dependent Clp protease protease subunit